MTLEPRVMDVLSMWVSKASGKMTEMMGKPVNM